MKLLSAVACLALLTGCEHDKDISPALAGTTLHIPPGYTIVQLGSTSGWAWALLKNTTTDRLKLVTFDGASGHVSTAADIVYDTIESSDLKPVESK